jgi:hypothetical protein
MGSPRFIYASPPLTPAFEYRRIYVPWLLIQLCIVRPGCWLYSQFPLLCAWFNCLRCLELGRAYAEYLSIASLQCNTTKCVYLAFNSCIIDLRHVRLVFIWGDFGEKIPDTFGTMWVPYTRVQHPTAGGTLKLYYLGDRSNSDRHIAPSILSLYSLFVSRTSFRLSSVPLASPAIAPRCLDCIY